MKIKDYEIKALQEMLEKNKEDNPRIARSFLEDVVSDLEELQALKRKGERV